MSRFSFVVCAKLAVAFGVLVCCAVVICIHRYDDRKQRDATELLNIFEGLKLGESTETLFDSQTQTFNRYVAPSRVSADGAVKTFRIVSDRENGSMLAVSLVFVGGRLRERGIGATNGKCCLVQLGQSLDDQGRDYSPGFDVLRANIAGVDSLRFNVNPNASSAEIRRFFDFNVKCVSIFHRCDSVDDLNRNATAMLRVSVEHGY